MIIKIDSKEDSDLLLKANLEQKKLKIEEPKKTNPSLIIYDVKTEYKEEELRKNLVGKNFDYLSDIEKKELMEEIVCKYRFRTKEDRVNWVVQMPAKFLIILTKKVKFLCNEGLIKCRNT